MSLFIAICIEAIKQTEIIYCPSQLHFEQTQKGQLIFVSLQWSEQHSDACRERMEELGVKTPYVL